MTVTGKSISDETAAFRCGIREALAAPAALLGAGFLGYGALAAENGYPAWVAVFASLTIWALPAQLILIDMHAVGAGALATVAAGVLSGARFLPMTLSLVPLMRDGRYGQRHYYVAAHLISMTGWAAAVPRFPDMPLGQRLPWFAGFALACLLVCAAATAAGHLLAGTLPMLVRLGLAFLTPVYFFVVLIGDTRTRLAGLALALGALCGPLFHLLSPQWSVLAAGFAGGTLAWLIERRHVRQRA